MSKKIRRIFASTIDFMIIAYVCSIPNKILKTFSNGDLLEIIITIVSVVIMVILYINKDCIIGYESLGKKIMNLKIYSNNERVLDKKILSNRIKKTLPTFPLYPLSILCEGKSAGDSKYNTEVR